MKDKFVAGAGEQGGVGARDQRARVRPIDGDSNGTALCDIGAFEAPLNLFLPLIMR